MSRKRFARVVLGMAWVFLSVGVLIPLLPQYVRGPLGESDGAVGLTVLLYALAGVVARPFIGVWLRTRDAWPLMWQSAAVAVVGLALTPVVGSFPWLIALRLVDGFALGAFYIAAATVVVQETPVARRGSALSYFSVPLFLGIALGPLLGDVLIARLGPNATWLAASAVLALAVPSTLVVSSWRAGSADRVSPSRDAGADAPPVDARLLLRTLAHPSAAWPAAILALTVAGWAAATAYIPLYGPQIGLSTTGVVFLVHSCVVLVIRVGGARLFDRMPLIEPVLVGAVANVVGLLVAWWWRAPAALLVTAGLTAMGVGLCYTTLMRVALDGVSAREQGAVIGAYSVSYDIGAGLGAAGLGVVVTLTGSYPAAFLGGAAAGLLGLVLLLVRFWARRSHYWVERITSTTPTRSVRITDPHLGGQGAEHG